MEKIIRILMERDKITREEAIENIEYVKEAIITSPSQTEELMLNELGLGMDYIDYIL